VDPKVDQDHEVQVAPMEAADDLKVDDLRADDLRAEDLKVAAGDVPTAHNVPNSPSLAFCSRF
jgi:hypothetical protein